MLNVPCTSTSSQSQFMTHRVSPWSKDGETTKVRSYSDFPWGLKFPLPPLERKFDMNSLLSLIQESSPSPTTCKTSVLITYPVWNPLYDTSMLLLGSQSNQRGWIPSRLTTLPLGLAWHIKMHRNTSLLLMKKSKVTWHRQGRIWAQQITSQNQQHKNQPTFRPNRSPHQPSPLR